MKTNYHQPVLLKESIDALQIKPDGIYIDATFGGGGHSREILNRLSGKGKLLAFDRDADAAMNIPDDKRLTLVQHDFRFLKNFADYLNLMPADGILADLGLSSHQVDTAERGFSFRYDADLDMRMDRGNPVTAKTILNNESAEQLQKIFSEYGEVRNARTLAGAIVKRRKGSPIHTTRQLMEIAEEVAPRKENPKKYAAPVFQALRIAVNDEIGGLKEFLEQSLEVLGKGGRLAVITYHSLEDRPVKNFIQAGTFSGQQEKDVFGKASSPWKVITRKPVIPSEGEIENNPRARSAKLRAAEKL